MSYKASSATFAALAATLALISSAPIARAATLTTGTDPTAVRISLTPVTNSMTGTGTVMGSTVTLFSTQNFNITTSLSGTVSPSSGSLSNLTVSAPVGEHFTDLTFTLGASQGFALGSGSVTVTATGSNGGPVSNTFPVGSLSSITQPLTFSDTIPLTSVAIATTTTSGFLGTTTVTGLSGFGVSGLSPIPLPATFVLFASGLGALGLLGWRRKRKSPASVLAA